MTDFIFPRARLLLFARAPVAGQVKTRLQPLLGREATLLLHKSLIKHTFQMVGRSRLCPLELWASENQHHEYFLNLCNKENIYQQEGVDLGARMANAAASALERGDYVILLGADCPSVDAAYLQEALGFLDEGHEVVIGPAEDGGYVLLGLRTVPAGLFTDMPWGSDSVMELTRERLRECGLGWQELAPRWDVDRPADLERLTSLQGWHSVEE